MRRCVTFAHQVQQPRASSCTFCLVVLFNLIYFCYKQHLQEENQNGSSWGNRSASDLLLLACFWRVGRNYWKITWKNTFPDVSGRVSERKTAIERQKPPSASLLSYTTCILPAKQIDVTSLKPESGVIIKAECVFEIKD